MTAQAADIKLERWADVVQSCNLALKLDEKNLKVRMGASNRQAPTRHACASTHRRWSLRVSVRAGAGCVWSLFACGRVCVCDCVCVIVCVCVRARVGTCRRVRASSTCAGAQAHGRVRASRASSTWWCAGQVRVRLCGGQAVCRQAREPHCVGVDALVVKGVGAAGHLRT